MADRVDAEVDAMQPPRCQPLVDCASAESKLQKLAPSHHTVLARRHPGEHPVTLMGRTMTRGLAPLSTQA